MRAKDRVKSAPESDLRLRHPSILASMRTILLDWMMEVRFLPNVCSACVVETIAIGRAGRV